MARGTISWLHPYSLRPICLISAFTVAFAASAIAGQTQTNPARQQPTFAASVNLVRVLVSARDANGSLTRDLSRTDFHIQDGGEEQTIAVFERNTSLPLSVAILVDSSGSTAGRLTYEEQSVRRFLAALASGINRADSFELISFNWRTSLELDWGRDVHRAERALRLLHGEGGTSLYDSVFLAANTLATRDGRHVMVIVTDGGDTTSYKNYADALEAAHRADAVLFPIVVVPVNADAGRNTGGEHALETLATATGGQGFAPAGEAQLDRAFNDILEALRSQYLLGFYPKTTRERPGSFHSIQVTTARPGVHLSTRSGYYEPSTAP